MPALETTIGARMCTSSCPFKTLTPASVKTQGNQCFVCVCGCVGVNNLEKTKPTASFLGVVEQDAVDWSSDQNSASCLLNDWDHVIGNLSGSALWVPGTVQVVRDQQTVHGETSIFGHVACIVEILEVRRKTVLSAEGGEEQWEDGSQRWYRRFQRCS